MKSLLAKSFLWKLLERISVQGSQFLVHIILARLLLPEHYGVLALMMVFIALANVIVQNGFNTALIQNRDIDDEDFSSVFWVVLLISIIIYFILFFVAPLLARFYEIPYLVKPFRVICLMLIPGALNSVQLAIIRRNMDFKKEFSSNFIAIVISGVFGITLAYLGFGLWALVTQTLLNSFIASITMYISIRWKPLLILNKQKIKKLFSYGYKLVLAGMLDTLYDNLCGLIIGGKYSSSSLGYYTRGNQFPNAIMGALNSSVQTVMLPALSMFQNDKLEAKKLMRKAMIFSAFFIFPMMAILAGIAKPLVQIVLTDKWLPCVPYIQIFCFSYAFWPVHTSNLQAINAMGRSDIFLRIEIYKKILGGCTLALVVYYSNDPVAIAATSIVMTMIGCFINCYPNKYLLRYSYSEQMRDILPYFSAAITCFLLIVRMDDIFNNSILTIVTQGTIAIFLYSIMTYVMKCSAWEIILIKLKRYKTSK